MATCGDESFNLMVYQEVARKSMTEMRTTDGLASLVEKTMGAYYRDSIKSGIFLGVIEEGETRFFHLFTSPSGSPRFYESRGYVLDGSCYRDAEAYLARYYDPNMEDVEVLQLLKHCVNLTAGRAIIDSREDAQKGNFHDPYVGGWVLGSIIQHGMPIPPLSFGTMCPNSDVMFLETYRLHLL
ncbi:uncharacterized protein LOC113319015 [Papaver somniferum]|uniref:uncharacterized protein LOC113319015 n=1 Tax=Papaver somniferum TaxID=3469 RepID=UPI000E6F68A3|nr:uncharacterized protein LOC113319015 [Papaver somniferum]